MKLTLYKNKSDRKVLDKDLDFIEELTEIKIKEGTDLIRPTFTFHKFGDGKWKDFNYACLEWEGLTDRYYYVEKPTILPGGIISINCEPDPRMTWKVYIRGLNTIISRQQYINNKAIKDDNVIVPLNRVLFSHNIGTVGDGGDGTIILTVTG